MGDAKAGPKFMLVEGDPSACLLQFWLCLNTCIGGGLMSAWLPVPAQAGAGVVTKSAPTHVV